MKSGVRKLYGKAVDDAESLADALDISGLVGSLAASQEHDPIKGVYNNDGLVGLRGRLIYPY